MNDDKKKQLEKIMKLIDEYAELIGAIAVDSSRDDNTEEFLFQTAKEKYYEIEGRIIRISLSEP